MEYALVFDHNENYLGKVILGFLFTSPNPLSGI